MTSSEILRWCRRGYKNEKHTLNRYVTAKIRLFVHYTNQIHTFYWRILKKTKSDNTTNKIDCWHFNNIQNFIFKIYRQYCDDKIIASNIQVISINLISTKMMGVKIIKISSSSNRWFVHNIYKFIRIMKNNNITNSRILNIHAFKACVWCVSPTLMKQKFANNLLFRSVE